MSNFTINKFTMFDIPNSFGELHDRRWLQRKKYYYQNPTQYKEHLKEEADQHWEIAKKGGINEEMSVNEALRKKRVEEEAKRREEEEKKRKEEEEQKRKEEVRKKEEARIAEQKRLAQGRGPDANEVRFIPNFPKVWDLSYVQETPQKIFMKKKDDTLEWDSGSGGSGGPETFFNFKAYVDEKNFFMTKFYENLDNLKWLNTEKVKDIRKSKFNINENFFNAVAAMYVLTWKSGFSLENISEKRNSNVITSLAKFHLYFWFKRFQKQPSLLEKHLTRDDYKFLMNKLKLYHTYTHKYEQTGRIWGLRVQKLNAHYGRGNWRNLRSTGRYHSGYTFEVVDKTLPVNAERQYFRFIRPKSNGLNSLGQTFLMQSIEAFIYSILGAQADSHFSIVNQGGRSYQTQTIFRQLVNSSIVQNDQTIMLNNYRTAIRDTYAILNQNISPGLLIIPSSLIILDKPIPGYNNTVRISDLSMRFGTEKDLNKVPLRLTGGGTEGTPQNNRKKEGGASEQHTFKSGLMEPDSVSSRHEYGHSKKGASSSAFDDLKKAKERQKVGASGGKDDEKSTQTDGFITSEGQSLVWALVAGLIGVISFELVFTSKGGFKGRVRT